MSSKTQKHLLYKTSLSYLSSGLTGIHQILCHYWEPVRLCLIFHLISSHLLSFLVLSCLVFILWVASPAYHDVLLGGAGICPRLEVTDIKVGQGVVNEAMQGTSITVHVLVDETWDEVWCEGDDKSLRRVRNMAGSAKAALCLSWRRASPAGSQPL